MRVKQRTTAWALSWLCVCVVVYASLYPFDDWRNQDIAPWFFVGAPWPTHNTWFDIYSNLLGYLPLGFWWCLAAMRSHWRRWQAVCFAGASACALSFAMECLQSYLPTRVPSQLDWLLNTLGGAAGAGLALALERRGWLYRWSQFRGQWLTADASGSLVLLALWPVALLYPVKVPFGLGHVSERVGKWLQDTLPAFEAKLTGFSDTFELALTPPFEMVCVTLGLLVPGLLALSVCQRIGQRRASLLMLGVLAVLANAMSGSLTYGPAHAWHWWMPPVWAGMAVALWLCLWVITWREIPLLVLMCAAQALLLCLLNLTPASTYFEQTMQTWEQGRFIRFHGLTPWLSGWWPWLLLVWAGWRVCRPRAIGERT